MDFSRNTNLENLFGILYSTDIPLEIPAKDRRGISRVLYSSCSYSAHTQEARMSLPGKNYFNLL